jgi:glycosyltransferase involved in cell wall biosynthesis
LKLNIFSYGFYPEQFLITEFAADAAAKNHQVQVFTGLPNYPKGVFFPGYSYSSGPYHETKDGYEIIRYPVIPRGKGSAKRLLNYLTHSIFALFNLSRLQKAKWAFVFGISPITIAIPAIITAKLRGEKVCLWLQDLWPDSVAAVGVLKRESFVYRAIGVIVSWIYKHIDVMLIQSPGFQENLKEFGYKGPVHFIPNWAPDVDFEKASVPDWFPADSGEAKFTVTFAGNIGKAQAIDTIMSAAEILKSETSIRFVLVGDGSDLSRAEDIKKSKDLSSVHFLGRRPVQEMPGLFKASDLLLVSLTRDPIFARTIPSKVQAYMAAGRPLVASLDGVGADVVLEARCGLTAPAEDAQGLAAAILKISKMSAADRIALGDNARSYFYQNFRKDIIIQRIFNILEQHK